uniref:Uncharacterized protein n=1 Tax=Pararge aegeria TaxID=116150 RepID=S4NYS3_9NEOP
MWHNFAMQCQHLLNISVKKRCITLAEVHQYAISVHCWNKPLSRQKGSPIIKTQDGMAIAVNGSNFSFRLHSLSSSRFIQ